MTIGDVLIWVALCSIIGILSFALYSGTQEKQGELEIDAQQVQQQEDLDQRAKEIEEEIRATLRLVEEELQKLQY